MADRANVASLEAIEAFRAQLIVYISKARPTLEEISSDVLRTRTWLEHEVLLHWQNEVKRRAKKLAEAQNELFSAQISNLREATSAEHLAVQKARRSLDEAEIKLRTVKKWQRDYAHKVEPLARQLEKFHSALANSLPEGVAWLTEVCRTLKAYAEVQAPGLTASSASEDETAGPLPSTEEGLS